MTESDKKALMEELRSANIPRQSHLRGHGGGGIHSPRPPAGPPPEETGAAGATGSVNTSFLELLRQFQAGEVSESEFLDELNAIKEELETNAGSVIDTTA
jgi:hypothetical protein